ncbi:MAG: helix-turn-helix transcriptional regulator [Erysipelotrichaceae bacterium]|nr:helix-turn-helix transcriptional regulator [Erysipelotrichaceae bacterium]
MSVGEKIKELRHRKGINQEQLGRDIGFDRTVISKWETGKKLPSEEQLVILEKYFDVSAEYFAEDNSEIKTSKKSAGISAELKVIIGNLAAVLLSPWLTIVPLVLTIYSVKKKMSILIVILDIITFLFCLNQILFVFGIDLIPSLVTVT